MIIPNTELLLRNIQICIASNIAWQVDEIENITHASAVENFKIRKGEKELKIYSLGLEFDISLSFRLEPEALNRIDYRALSNLQKETALNIIIDHKSNQTRCFVKGRTFVQLAVFVEYQYHDNGLLATATSGNMFDQVYLTDSRILRINSDFYFVMKGGIIE